ncbi:ABC transporter ATP-binding protein [Devosia nitrariae]|uniref:ABC transporter ATP-binding protein n=1 Tax=Devosia nitrariae TaxID=2071872 RepID=A0ABQ5W5G0_9HYPH|nr:oligopeptide/dipeptide ABC transporter ATP-binding protein [Devosia nitrariae]GLQ55170.1 ABC transporter ATP-binding protein [Devosia nitrariae]
MTLVAKQGIRRSGSSDRRTPIYTVEGLRVHFPITRGVMRRIVGQVKAVDDISFIVYRGETLGLVGESGCGKTTTGRALLRIVEPTGGRITYTPPDGDPINVRTAGRDELKAVRRAARMVFQDPNSSLNPRLPVGEIIGEGLHYHGIARGAEIEDRVADMLRRVGLRPEYIRRYPHAFSGGERQRIGIARALAVNPNFVICDEAVSALDVSVQAQILRLLRELKDEFDLTYLFVGHDLAVIQHICDRVAVMYAGKLVEIGPTQSIFATPRHPYTEALLSAVPRPDPRVRGTGERVRLAGEVADVSNLPSGCAFHPRCRYATERCKTETPQLRPVGEQMVACHFADSLTLKGVGSYAA